jgi:hypothetical protein
MDKPTQSPQELFEKINIAMKDQVSLEFIESTRTVKANTQNSERCVITKIKEILDGMGLTYQEAGSQQSKDFRNVGGIGLNIEIKKTDSTVIFFNDTLPSEDIYYIVIFTGKQYTNTPEKNIPPQLCFMNGVEFLVDSEEWIKECKAYMNVMKDTYARGENKKKLTGIMSCYPRHTWTADISSLLVGGVNSIDYEEKKAQREAAKQAEREAAKQAKQAEREAAKQAKQAEREAAKQAKQAEREAAKQAKRKSGKEQTPIPQVVE